MSNVIELKPKEKDEPEVKELVYPRKRFLNDGAFYIAEILTRQGKYTKKQIQECDFYEDVKPIGFYLYDLFSKVCWSCRYCGFSDNRKDIEFKIQNKSETFETAENPLSKGFRFPFKNLKCDLRRKKTASWIMEETFSPIFGKESVRDFMLNESIFHKEHNFILYE